MSSGGQSETGPARHLAGAGPPGGSAAGPRATRRAVAGRAVAGIVAAGLLAAGLLVSGCVPAPSDPAGAPQPATTAIAPSTAPPPPPAAPLPSIDRSLQAGRDATVRVRNLTCAGLGTGSGFVLAGGALITATHVVVDGTDYDAETWDGMDLTVDSASARVPTGLDLAVLSVVAPPGRALELAPADPVPGDTVRALGYPLGRAFEARTGTIGDVVVDPRLGVNGPVLVMDIALEPGNSGGPVIDGAGRVVGVVYARRASDGKGLAMPASSLRHVLEGQIPANNPPPTRC